MAAVGDPDRFVGLAYELLLGRPADADGLAHYTGAIGRGDTRTSVLRSLIAVARILGALPPSGATGRVIPRDTQLCELANPAKWDNPEWTRDSAQPRAARRQAVDASEGVRVHPAAVRADATRSC